MAIKLRRGLEIDRMPIVFAQGEIIYVIDTKKVYIGDGVTFGGNLVTGEELLTALDDVQISSLANNNLLSYNSSLSKWQNKAVTTTHIPEGTNLYFTNERVDDRVAQMLLAGANVTLTYNDNANTLTIDAAGNVQSVNTKTGAVVLTTTDIADSTNKRYITDAQLVVVGNTSGTNTGDQTLTGLGGVPTTRTLTINGTTQDLSADRAFTIATGITIGTTPITLGEVGRVLFEGTGNVVSGSANLFWDNTNARLGVGTSSPSAIIHSVGSVTATSLIARGAFLNNTLVASANNDVLVGLDIQPTFTNGAFTGTRNIVTRFLAGTVSGNNGAQIAIRQTDGTGIGAVIGMQGGGWNALGFWGADRFPITSTPDLRIFSTGIVRTSGNFIVDGNALIGTITDAGFKLDVNGSVRVNSTTIPQGNSFLVLSTSNRTLSFNLSGVGGTYSSLSTGLNSATGSGSFGVTLDGYGTAFIIGSSNNSTSNARFSVNLNSGNAAQTEVIIGTQTSSASSLLTLNSTVRGFLLPRMTTIEKNAIASPATALQVYDTTLNVISLYNGTNWVNGTGAPNVRHDYVEPYSYVGTATQSSLEGSNVWKITRIQNLTDANVLITTALNVSWSNRLTHTYS
jgi:hypothetical protein